MPILAWEGKRIVADGIIRREPGLWTSHVGVARLLVHPEYRRRGAGTQLLRELIGLADELELHKLIYECAADQKGLVLCLQQVGFTFAEKLAGFIRDCDSRAHDLLLMEFDLGA